MLFKNEYSSPLGNILVVTDEQSVKGVWFENQKYYGASYDVSIMSTDETDCIKQVRKWLDDYFSCKHPKINSALLKPEVTPFRGQVLELLTEIPYGQTTTYQQLATQFEKRYGKKTSARAIGGAVGHNPLSILIPCHRVIGSNNELTGYAGGITRKIELLSLEQYDVSTLRY